MSRYLLDTTPVAGGNNVADSNSLSSAELFNLATGTWQATGSLNFAREGQLSALLQNGNVLVVGGRDCVNGTFTDLASAELCEPSQGKWSVTSSLSIPDGTPFGSLLPMATCWPHEWRSSLLRPVLGPPQALSRRFVKEPPRRSWELETCCSRDSG
jgi:hypothetical protein